MGPGANWVSSGTHKESSLALFCVIFTLQASMEPKSLFGKVNSYAPAKHTDSKYLRVGPGICAFSFYFSKLSDKFVAK